MQKRFLIAFAVLLAPYCGHSSLIAVNENVGGLMDAGGSSSDYALYQIDGVSVTNGSVSVGYKTSFNELRIINGGTYTCEGNSWGQLDRSIGYGSGTASNRLTV